MNNNLTQEQLRAVQTLLNGMSTSEVNDLMASQQAGYALSKKTATNMKKFVAINAGLVIGGTLLGGVLGGLIGANCASTKGGIALAAGLGATVGLAGGSLGAVAYTRHNAEKILDEAAEALYDLSV